MKLCAEKCTQELKTPKKKSTEICGWKNLQLLETTKLPRIAIAIQKKAT
jgi:hypothetical protein